MVQIKTQECQRVENLPSRSFWCGDWFMWNDFFTRESFIRDSFICDIIRDSFIRYICVLWVLHMMEGCKHDNLWHTHMSHVIYDCVMSQMNKFFRIRKGTVSARVCVCVCVCACECVCVCVSACWCVRVWLWEQQYSFVEITEVHTSTKKNALKLPM